MSPERMQFYLMKANNRAIKNLQLKTTYMEGYTHTYEKAYMFDMLEKYMKSRSEAKIK